MTNIQRAFCVVLSLIFLCVVAVLPGDFFRHGEVYRHLPLYCFLEKKALQKENGRDRETEMLLQKKNAEHLGEEVEAENPERAGGTADGRGGEKWRRNSPSVRAERQEEKNRRPKKGQNCRMKARVEAWREKEKEKKKSRKPWHCLILRLIYLRRNWQILIM